MRTNANPRTVTVSRIPLHGENRFLECKVYFNAGGINYATYKKMERGFYASVCPITVKDNSISFMMLDGQAIFLGPADRFNSKQLANWAAKIMEFGPFKELVEKFKVREGGQ